MQYRLNKKNGDSLSLLGFGCLRFPRKNGKIDFEETQREILEAVRLGVNYFDTAYVYGGSEETLGKILAQNGIRKSVYIATKLPHYYIKKTEDFERFFAEELQRLQTDYVDYYLIHMLPDVATWRRLQTFGIEEWLLQKKQSGMIRNIGFSYHGNTVAFQELLDVYDWDFCQIQYNYMDEHSQAGRAGLLKAAKKGMPVIIMEPLRGGRLVHGLPKEAGHLFSRARFDWSPAEWGLRWLWDQPQVTVVLSGMNSMEMLRENVRIASDVRAGELGEAEFALYRQVIDIINRRMKVPCTGCGYCMPCPAGVDIPGVFRCYNERYTDNYYTGMKEYFMCTTMRAKHSGASQCVRCGKCESHCPQQIPIREKLAEAAGKMESPVYHVAKWVMKRIGRF